MRLGIDEDAYEKIGIEGQVDNFYSTAADRREVLNQIHDYEMSLDAARQGDVCGMFSFIGLGLIAGMTLDREVAQYSYRPRQWRRDMERLVADLKEAGF